MDATDPVTLTVLRGARDVARRAAVARLAALEQAIVSAEHDATATVRRALDVGGSAYAGRVAEFVAALLSDLTDAAAAERARIRQRVEVNYAEIPEDLRDLDHRVGAFRRARRAAAAVTR